MKREIRIPSILGLLVFLLAIFVGIYLVSKPVAFKSKASGDCQPIGLQITNLTHTSFDISFITTAWCLSAVNIDGRTIHNIRSTDPQRVHYFQINGLAENTSYTYSVVSGELQIDKDDWSVKTANKPKSQLPTSNLAWGKVLNPDLSPAADTIIYLTIPGAMPLSSFVTSSGNWNISLANSFTDQMDDWFTPPDNLDEDIIVISADGQVTQVVNTTSNNNPVPDIIIGQDTLNFVDTRPVSGQLTSPDSSQSQLELTVANPSEGDILSSSTPDIFGTAPIDSIIDIRIETSTSAAGQVTPSPDGSWHWSPTSSLGPGEHTLVVTASGQTIIRKFVVNPFSDGLTFSASDSARPNSPTPTSIPTPPPPTVTPTSIPTTAPTPTIVSLQQPTPTPNIPVTGEFTPTILTMLSALLLVSISVLIIRR